MSASKLTWAIRYTGNGAGGPGAWMYVTAMDLGDLKHRTGYGYCCPCKETLQFPTKKAAEDFCREKDIPVGGEGGNAHTVVDSVTARKEKDAHKRDAPRGPVEAHHATKPKSALTGKVIKA